MCKTKVNDLIENKSNIVGIQVRCGDYYMKTNPDETHKTNNNVDFLKIKTICQQKFNNNYTGSSKKTEYARYIKRTRGTETFASKKITSTQVKNRVNCQLEQFPTYCSNNLNRFPFTVVPSSYKDTSTSV